jgi:hypothetical protein
MPFFSSFRSFHVISDFYNSRHFAVFFQRRKLFLPKLIFGVPRMMRFFIILFFILSQSVSSSANINYIKWDKIPGSSNNTKFHQFMINNQRFFDHWSPEWNYDVAKSTLIDSLELSFRSFDNISDKTAESHLLLGVISHYLYNLDVQNYFDTAVLNFTTAIELDSADFRGHWFLGFHYTLSGKSEKGVHEIFYAQQLLTDEVPVAFWEDYIQATHLAQMPSHSLMGMSVIRNGIGEPGYMERNIGDAVRKRFLPTFSDSSYRYQDIWQSNRQDYIIFTSRTLGMSFAIDSTWGLTFYDFKNGQTFVMIKPPGITNAKGQLITYTIAVMIRSPKGDAGIESMMEPLMKPYPIKNKFTFSEQIPVNAAYEVRDPNMYSNIGGAHFNFVGFHRNEPQFPGMDLEIPGDLNSNGSTGEVTYLKFNPFYTRLNGPIQYTFLLDTCEDIYEESHIVFKNFLINQVILE